jgi:hypothetical protein
VPGELPEAKVPRLIRSPLIVALPESLPLALIAMLPSAVPLKFNSPD